MPMNIPFTKMHGLGNDFILVEEDQIPAELDLPELAKHMCDRHFGVGADGLIIVGPPDDLTCDIKFVIYNSDGSQPEMCGNGIRCFARYVKDQGLIKRNTFKVQTLAGVITPHINDDYTVTVDMGRPILSPAKIPFVGQEEGPVLSHPLEILPGLVLPVQAVSMGNPHCIIFRQDAPNAALDFRALGPRIETNPAFPAKTNVEFVDILDARTVRVQVWERGAGETLACGTGACAVAVAGMLRQLLEPKVSVELPGGPLTIEWNGRDAVFMTGPATYVFAGTYPVTHRSLLAYS